MAKVTFIVPIDELHGKICKGFGAAQRSEVNNEGERKPYTVFYGKRSTAPSDAEVAQRNDFGNISKLIKQRKLNPTKRAQDAAAFKAQSTYRTMKAYLWHTCAAEYEASQS